MSCCKSMLVLIGAVSLGHMAGCDRGQVATSAPATAPAATMPATAPAAAEFRIGGQPFQFEQPRISIDRDSSPPRVLIYSAKDSPAGSFYFEVPLEPETSVSEGETITWEQQVQPRDLQDSLVGIELTANRQTLQPQSLRVEVRIVSKWAAEASLSGEFLVYVGEDIKPRGTHTVLAQFPAGIDEK